MTPEDDIAERRRAEEALLESAEKLRALLESASQGVVVADGQGRVVFANRLAEEIFGYSRDELLGQPVENLIPEGLREAHVRHRTDYLSSPRIRLMGPGLDLVGRRKDGTQFPLDCGVSFVETEDGILVMALITDITERKRAEEELRKLSRAVEQSASLVIITDHEGNIEYVNPKFTHVTGYTLQEVIGKNPRVLKSGETPPEEYKRLWETITSGGEWRGELHNKRKDGQFYWAFASISPVRNEAGIITHFIGVQEDITERKQAEEALRESEERFRRLSSAALEGIVISENGTVLDANEQLARILGYDLTAIIGMRALDFTAPESRDLVSQNIQSQHDEPYEHLALRKDGSIFPVEVCGKPMPYDGRTVRVTAIRDISARKRAEEALRESEERFRVSLMNSPVVVWSQDSELRYTWIHNPVPGFTVEDILGKTDEDLLPPEEASHLTVIKRQVLESGAGTREEIQAVIHGEVTFHDLTVEPLRDATGTIVGITGASVDITERKRAEEALQKARDELEGKVERQLLRRNPYGLTFRELTVLHKVAAGRSDKEIGLELVISPLTAQKHISNILAKMDVASRTEAASRAIREGLLE